jgi:hypothetical protein
LGYKARIKEGISGSPHDSHRYCAVNVMVVEDRISVEVTLTVAAGGQVKLICVF